MLVALYRASGLVSLVVVVVACVTVALPLLGEDVVSWFALLLVLLKDVKWNPDEWRILLTEVMLCSSSWSAASSGVQTYLFFHQSSHHKPIINHSFYNQVYEKLGLSFCYCASSMVCMYSECH